MEDRQFDAVSKRFGAAQLTRGGLLRGVLGAAAAAVTGAVLASSETDAKRKKRRKAKAGNAARAKSQTIEPPRADRPRCRPAGHPCEGNQVCCSGACEVTGPGNAKRCVENAQCGASGQACCPGDPKCQSGLECEKEICVPIKPECGAEGQDCCKTGDPCQGGLTCDEGTCVPACGGAGESCCADAICDSGLECLGGYCVVPCGGESQICCNNNACGPTLTCVGDPGTCEACGGEGDICCAGDACGSGLQCISGTCTILTPGGSCTSTTDCPPGSVCNSGTCVSFGIACNSGETALQCCYRSVRKGCKRKQQSKHARKNCMKKGKRRCNALLTGV